MSNVHCHGGPVRDFEFNGGLLGRFMTWEGEDYRYVDRHRGDAYVFEHDALGTRSLDYIQGRRDHL